jgi:hypothetical protein
MKYVEAVISGNVLAAHLSRVRNRCDNAAHLANILVFAGDGRDAGMPRVYLEMWRCREDKVWSFSPSNQHPSAEPPQC